MNVDFRRSIAHPDHTVVVEVLFVGFTVGEGHLPEQGVTDAVDDAAFRHVYGRVGVDDDAAVDGADHFVHHRPVSFHTQIEDVGGVGIVAEVGGDATVDAGG